MSLRDFCIALLAGGVGIGGGMAVQDARATKPVVAKKPAGKRVAARKATARAVPAAPASPILFDCPLPSVSGGGALPSWPAAMELTPFPMAAAFPLFDGGYWGGGGDGSALPSPPPAIPEPLSWSMMITGFGLIGLSLRRKGRTI